MRTATSASILGLWVAFGLVPALAQAKEPVGTKAEVGACIAASEQVQELRRQGKLQKARDAVAGCMNTKCPAMIRTDCDEFSRTLEAALPTLLLRVTSKAGGDVSSAKLTLDGVEVALDGRALDVDPGTHQVSASAEGFEPSTTRIVVQEGAKNRAVELQLVPKGAALASSSATPAAKSSRTPATGTWIATGALGVTAVAALSVFAGMGLSANGRFDELEAQCGGRCASSDVDKLRTRYLVADVSLVVGVVSAVAAGAVFLLGPRKHVEPAAQTARR